MPDLPYKGKWSAENDALAVEAGFESWQAWGEAIEADVGYVICGGRTSKGSPCQQPAGRGVPDKDEGRCKFHGGAAPRGALAANFQGKGQSRYLIHLPDEVKDAFRAYVEDPEMFSLQQEIALTRTSIEALLAQWPRDVASVQEISDMAERGLEAIDSRDPVKLAAALKELREGLEPVAMAMAIDDKVEKKIDTLRKLVDSNLKREKVEFDQVSAARLGMWTMTMQQLLLDVIEDEDTRQLVLQRMQPWIG